MGFWERALKEPGWLAVVDPDGTEHAAGDLLGRANQVVHALRARGLKAGDAIAALLPNGIAPQELYLAALQAGWYYVPINWHFTAARDRLHPQGHRREGVLRARALRRGWRGRRRRGRPPGRRAGSLRDGARLPVVRRPACRPARRDLPDDRTAGAAMHYTSGTTGRPKGVDAR